MLRNINANNEHKLTILDSHLYSATNSLKEQSKRFYSNKVPVDIKILPFTMFKTAKKQKIYSSCQWSRHRYV